MVNSRRGSIKSAGVETIIIPPDVLLAINEIPSKPLAWQPWQDEVLIRYHTTKTKANIAKVIDKSYFAVKERLRKLRREGKIK